MGQKTHPIGFRIGVQTKSNIAIGYHSKLDLHGQCNRWAVSNVSTTYSDLVQRDRQIKEVIEEYMYERGYLTNKYIITRSVNYVGVYVDGIQMKEPNITTSYFNRRSQSEHQQVNQFSSSRSKLEYYISQCIEHGQPVHIQFTNLVNRTASKDKQQERTITDVLEVLRKNKIPCCNVVTKVLVNMINNGQREREVLRSVTKTMNKYTANYLRVFKGRIGGSERSRIIRYRNGPMPRHTVSAAIDQGYSEVNTASGKVSIKLMVYFN